MPSSIDLDNGGERFNIHLDTNGNLKFNANATGGNGDTRLLLSDDNGQLTIGGSGQSGQVSGTFGKLQLKSPSDDNTIFIGASDTEATALVGGGGSGGRVKIGNPQGLTTIDMSGSGQHLRIGDSQVFTIEAFAAAGQLFLGADPSGTDGNLYVRDGNGGISINLSGNTGICSCVSVVESSDLRLKKGIAPLLNALDKVQAMRGVRYQRKHEGPKKVLSEDSQIGFIGQEMETVCPEIVSTDSEGYKSINYSRLTPILVEAIKEQQKLIRRQASALGEALERIARIETALKEQSA
jgi:Chaperone of endosialidase